MSLLMHILGWFFLLLNTLCFFRLGLLPMIFFFKNYALYKKIFLVSVAVTLIFAASEYMLLKMLLTIEVR